MKLEITVNLDACAPDDLIEFAFVEGEWGVSDPRFLHLVACVAADEASVMARGIIPAEDFKVELFRDDGRSLDGSDGIRSGNLLVTRK